MSVWVGEEGSSLNILFMEILYISMMNLLIFLMLVAPWSVIGNNYKNARGHVSLK